MGGWEWGALVCLRADRDGRGRAGGSPEGLKGEHSQRKAGGGKEWEWKDTLLNQHYFAKGNTHTHRPRSIHSHAHMHMQMHSLTHI